MVITYEFAYKSYYQSFFIVSRVKLKSGDSRLLTKSLLRIKYLILKKGTSQECGSNSYLARTLYKLCQNSVKLHEMPRIEHPNPTLFLE